MKAGMRRWMLRAGRWVSALALATASLAEAQQSTVGGVVTDEATGQPLEAARVILTGPNRIEATNQEGRYLFRNVAPGSYAVRVLRLGYRPATDTANVAPGEEVALDFALTGAPVQLDEIVTTATGEQRKLEVANAVSTIDAARVTEESPISEFGNLLSGRAAGVQVQKTGGTTGTGTRIRIRGSNSVSLSNEPLYYIDGIRMESGATSSTLDIGGFGQGVGAAPSRINDLNPEDIESIEIVKGPAAATLYGIQASNGVVRITTKRGRAGRARWNLYSEAGAVRDHNTYPINFNGRDDTDATGADWDGFCIVQFELDGLCTQTSVSQFSPLDDPFTSPLKPGFRQQHGVNVSGGNELLTYYLSGDYENEDGVYRLPDFEADSVAEVRGERARQPAPAQRAGAGEPPRQPRRQRLGQRRPPGQRRLHLQRHPVRGERQQLPHHHRQRRSQRRPRGHEPGLVLHPGRAVRRAGAAVHRAVHRRPHRQLAAHVMADHPRHAGLRRRQPARRPVLPHRPGGGFRRTCRTGPGLKFDNRFQISQTSVDLAATARFKLSPTLGSKTSVGRPVLPRPGGRRASPAGGASRPARDHHRRRARPRQGTPRSSPARSAPTSSRSSPSRSGSSSPAPSASTTTAPSARTSTPRSIPRPASPGCCPTSRSSVDGGFISTLRLRGAFGVSGQQPGTTDALRFFSPDAGKRGGVAAAGDHLRQPGQQRRSSRSAPASSRWASTPPSSRSG